MSNDYVVRSVEAANLSAFVKELDGDELVALAPSRIMDGFVVHYKAIVRLCYRDANGRPVEGKANR